MFKNKLNYKIINLTALMVLLYFGFINIGLWWGVLTKCVSLLTPFIVGFAFAYAFTPLVRLLERKGVKHTLAVIIVIVGILVIVFGLLAIILPMLYDQLSLFIKMIIEVFENINDKVPINIGKYEIKITDYLNDILAELRSATSSTVMGYLGKSIDFLSSFILGFVGFVYFLGDMNKIRSSSKKIMNTYSKRFYQYVKLMDTEITNYLKGIEMFMVIQFFEYSLLFLIIGHPNWLILGLLACITTVIPYFGGLITNLIAILMASVVSVPLMIATTIICLIFPQLDGYVISPKVYGKTNNVNPLITIMAVSIGGTLAGVVGIVIALPCYLLIRTTFRFFIKDLKKGVNMVKETI